jgi:hypothetical protein
VQALRPFPPPLHLPTLIRIKEEEEAEDSILAVAVEATEAAEAAEAVEAHVAEEAVMGRRVVEGE